MKSTSISGPNTSTTIWQSNPRWFPMMLFWELLLNLAHYFNGLLLRCFQTTPSSPEVQPYSVVEELPNDLFWKILHHLDSHSLRNLLRAYPSLGQRVTLVLGPHHEGNGEPIFFTGFPIGDLHCSDGGELPYCQGSVNLYEINTRSKHFQWFIEIEMKQLKSMSFIHFTGNVSVMGKTCIMKTLNSMHPFAPRISFQYSAPQKHNDESTNGSHRRLLNSDCVTESTNISIDCLSSTHTVDDMISSWKNIKQLEIVFYSGDHTPIIQGLDLPQVQSFRIKYYEKLPLIFNTKVGYASKGYSVFEMLNTAAFDVHYGTHHEGTMRWSIYEDRMDLSFTENFDSFFFVGVDGQIIFKFCNFSRATSLFWYESAYMESLLDGISDDARRALMSIMHDKQLRLDRVRNFTYATNREHGSIPSKIKIPELEVVRVYTSNSNLQLGSAIGDVYSEWASAGNDDGSCNSKFKSVDICCDLPLEQVGSDGHMVLDLDSILAILYSEKSKFVNISGCYIAKDNHGLLYEDTDLIQDYAVLHNGPGLPVKRILKIELVRKIGTGENPMKPVVTYLLAWLATYLTYLKITQASGGESYTPWYNLAVPLPYTIFTEGLVVDIDPSFGNPTLVYYDYDEGIEYANMVEGKHADQIPESHEQADDSRMWMAIRQREDTGHGPGWKMVPI